MYSHLYVTYDVIVCVSPRAAQWHFERTSGAPNCRAWVMDETRKCLLRWNSICLVTTLVATPRSIISSLIYPPVPFNRESPPAHVSLNSSFAATRVLTSRAEGSEGFRYFSFVRRIKQKCIESNR